MESRRRHRLKSLALGYAVDCCHHLFILKMLTKAYHHLLSDMCHTLNQPQEIQRCTRHSLWSIKRGRQVSRQGQNRMLSTTMRCGHLRRSLLFRVMQAQSQHLPVLSVSASLNLVPWMLLLSGPWAGQVNPIRKNCCL